MKIHLQGVYAENRVWLNGQELNIEESRARLNKSQEFAWGYGGSGPAQLAFEICRKLNLKEHFQDFKFKYIGRLPESDFDVIIDLETGAMHTAFNYNLSQN